MAPYYQAVVLTLKAKRGSRGGGRRPRPSKSAHHAPQSTDNNNAAPGAEAIPANTESIDGGVAKGGADVDASRARTNADEADALAKSLRLGLGLRDEVVACAEAGDLYQGEAFALAQQGLKGGRGGEAWLGLACRFEFLVAFA